MYHYFTFLVDTFGKGIHHAIGKPKILLLFLIVFIFMYPSRIQAQFNCCGWVAGEGKTEIRQANYINDWSAKFEYNVYNDIGDFNEWEWETGDNWNAKHLPLFNTNNSYNGNNTGYNLSYMPLGPGVNILKDIRAEFGGGSTDDNYDNIVFATTGIIAPSSVSVTKVGIFRIEIEWVKGSSMPDSETEYKIHLNGTVIATVDGTSRSYVYEGLQASTNYSIGVATYTKGGSKEWNGITYSTWSAQTSSYRTISQRTNPFTINASDGEFANKVKITWPQVSLSADNIRIERSLPATNPLQYEELNISNKHATAYTDTDAIPGYRYTYRITPLDANGDPLVNITDQGYQKPNGIVKGQVLARGGAGVQGVSICVLPLQPVSPAGAVAMPAGGYCTTTDASGNYEIRNIYYFDSASFVVVPSYQSHIFGPPSRITILDLNSPIQSGINFTDSTSISIFGKVHFPDASEFGATGANLIGVRGAKIILDSLDRGIRTNAEGNWSYAVTDPGTYYFSVRYKHHEFEAAPGFASVTKDSAVVVVVDTDISGVNFVDLNVDSVLIKVQDGCGDPLAVYANGDGSTPRIRVRGERGPTYFEKFVNMNAKGEGKVVLPAAKFDFDVSTSPPFQDPNVEAQLTDTTLTFDLTVRDSTLKIVRDTTLDITPSKTVTIGGVVVTLPADTTVIVSKDTMVSSIQPLADFTYFGPLKVEVNFRDAGAEVFPTCTATGIGTVNDSIILMEVGIGYQLEFIVTDQFSGCLVDSGRSLIYDYIGDLENDPIKLPIKKGVTRYTVVGGEPNVASGGGKPYQKLLFISVSAGVRSPDQMGWWILLQGARELTPTFTSRSPELPDLVVHDPPGDNSYAWVEKGSSYTSFETKQYETSGSAGVYVDAILGSGVTVSKGSPFFSTESKVYAGVKIDFEFLAGRENYDKLGFTSTYSFEETFSTSDDPLFTGYDGDVYIGKSVNQLWSVAKVLEFDPATCTAAVEDKPNLEPFGIASTFVYSEKHIKRVLIPQLDYLADILQIQADKETNVSVKDNLVNERDSFRVDIVNWNRILAHNAANRDTNAVFDKNLSFSAGASYQSTSSYDSTSSSSFEYLTFINTDLKLGFAFKVEGDGFWNEGKAGAAANFRKSWQKEVGTDSTNSFSVGYFLADKDIGDYFSVDVLRDTAYNVPAFRVFGGTSSCPQEPGTQARDKSKINIFPPRQDNVAVGSKATFTTQLINESESQEAREYQVRVIPQTNPGGAVVKLGGQLINNSAISYFIDAFQANEIDLTVEPGPRAANYEKIGIMMFPPCEYELWENNGDLINGDTAYITVNFESECSNVTLKNPVDKWLVNANSDNKLLVDFTGYDLGNPYLQSIHLDYKPDGQGWQEALEIPKDSILDLIYRKIWDVSALLDGPYSLRARAECGSGRGYTASSPVSGFIDRSALGPFGIPTPSDGFLRLGQEISVTFDSDIECDFGSYASPAEISLIRLDDSSSIPVTVQCSENQDRIILVPTVNLFNMPDLEDVLLRARVVGMENPGGNVQTYPIEWTFEVNASPVFWDPDSLFQKGFTGQNNIIKSSLKNEAVFTKAFEITDYPVWLVPSSLSGSVLSNGEYKMEFVVDPGLPPGIFRDTVVAMVDGWPEYLDITYESLAIPPNWVVNPEKYDYSMNMVLVFSLDQTNTNLSRDDRDMIAAIYNGEVRGVAQLEYVQQFDKYMAFLTVYSNIPANEEISFSMWRASSGVEYRAKETFYFASEMVYGRIAAPEILHPDGVFQVIPLKQGWNWVSLNVRNQDMTIHNLLNSLGSPDVGNNITVKNKLGATSTFTQIATPIIYTNQWYGNIQQLDNKQMYMINLSDKPDTLRIPGNPITNFDQIDMLSGWNWIGYQPQETQTLDQALSSVNLRNRDILKAQESFSEYHRGSSTWYGPLQFMQPGKGYKLRLRSGVIYNNLVYSRLGLQDFEVDHTLFESSMTLIGSLGEVPEGTDISPERLLVGAFIDDSCRGSGYIEYVEFLKSYRVIFSFHGNAMDIGRKLRFKVYDTHSGQEFISNNDPEIYVTDRILGSMEEPYQLFERFALPEAGYYLEQNYPNPYDSRTTIRYILPQDETVKLSVYDQFGKLLSVLVNENQQAGEHSVIFDASKLPGGFYHYSIEAGEYRASRKMVKF